jgi:hypothetical protein
MNEFDQILVYLLIHTANHIFWRLLSIQNNVIPKSEMSLALTAHLGQEDAVRLFRGFSKQHKCLVATFQSRIA